MHQVVYWLFFVAALAVTLWAKGANVVQSSNSGINSLRHYFLVQGPVLAPQVLLSIGGFVAFVHALPLDAFATNIGSSVAYGFGIQSALNLVTPLAVPGLRRDVPPRNGGSQDPPESPGPPAPPLPPASAAAHP